MNGSRENIMADADCSKQSQGNTRQNNNAVVCAVSKCVVLLQRQVRTVREDKCVGRDVGKKKRNLFVYAEDMVALLATIASCE